MVKQINVVGAALIEDGKVLVTRRNDDRVLGNLWEFPGGKINNGETPQQALKRELMEEFNDQIEVGEKVADMSSHRYDFGTVNLTVYFARFVSHHFDLVAHDKVVWVKQNELNNFNWADADKLAAETIQKTNLTQVNFNGIN